MLSISPNSVNPVSFGEIFMKRGKVFLANSVIHNTSSRELSDEHTDTFGASSKFVTTSNSPVKSPSSVVQPSGGPVPPRLQERILGKAPLRLVVARVPQFVPPQINPTHWIETLECGHVTEAYLQFRWDDGHLVNLIPSAKRRRCQPCKALEALSLPPRKPVQSVRPVKKERAS